MKAKKELEWVKQQVGKEANFLQVWLNILKVLAPEDFSNAETDQM
jgi:DNA relaxase NicK